MFKLAWQLVSNPNPNYEKLLVRAITAKLELLFVLPLGTLTIDKLHIL